jgi:hypothetical protein
MVDFAKDLLLQMLIFSGGDGANRLRIGDRPIIFVCHSMGGLVVKKAYLLGKHDPEFAHIISQVYGIIFLGTPHRGIKHAKALNNILSTGPVTSAKSYIADLHACSTAVQDLNEQFRIAGEELSLFSFWEALKTRVGPIKILVSQQSPVNDHSTNENRWFRGNLESLDITTRTQASQIQTITISASSRAERTESISL